MIAFEMRDDLGDWITHRLHHGVLAQGRKAKAIMEESGVAVTELRAQWALQKEAQLSIRARMSPVSQCINYDTYLESQMHQHALKENSTRSSVCRAISKQSTKPS